MRVFVAGATGVLGRALLPLLLAAGHEVIGLARSPEKLLQVERSGGRGVRGDVLDADSLRRLIRETQPEVIVNLATAIPLKLRVNPKDWELNDRVRVEGTTHLLAGAQEVGVRLFVQESVGYVCQPQGDRWLEEDSPLSTHPFLRATIQMEEMVRASSVPATLLRLGALMSADAWHTQQSIAALKRGLLPIIGDGDAYLSLIHTDDAARAFLAALDAPHIAAGQTYHVAEDEPSPMRVVLPYAAERFQAPAPRHVALFLAKMAVGTITLEVLAASYRMCSAKLKRDLSYAPAYPTYREIWTQIAQATHGQDFAPSEDLQ